MTDPEFRSLASAIARRFGRRVRVRIAENSRRFGRRRRRRRSFSSPRFCSVTLLLLRIGIGNEHAPYGNHEASEVDHDVRGTEPGLVRQLLPDFVCRCGGAEADDPSDRGSRNLRTPW